jgi:hypothetical protein
VIRQICPHCQKMVEIPEDGNTAPCPQCSQSITVPKTYSIQVDPSAVKPSIPTITSTPVSPASATSGSPSQTSASPTTAPSASAPPLPPPGLPPGMPSPPRLSADRPAPPPGLANPTIIARPSDQYTGSFPITLSSNLIPWIVAGCLTAIFVLMMFPWSGSYSSGTSVYSQSFWGALSNSFTTNTSIEQVYNQEANIQKAVRSDWWILLPYLFLVLIGIVLAWADRLVQAADFAYRIGPLGTVRALIWPRRGLILFAIAAATLALFALETLRGFGLEAGIRTVALQQFDEDAKKAQGNSSETVKVNAKIGKEVASYGLASGYAFWLVALAHIIAIIATGLRIWLDDRGPTTSLPRMLFEW